MLQYLRSNHLFETLLGQHYPTPAVGTRRVYAGVKVPFLRWDSTMRFESPAFQESFLHAQARVAHVEVMDLVCAQMSWPLSRESYIKLGRLRWVFGAKLVRRDGETYWSTETAYGSATGGVVTRRRDVFHVHGSEYVARQHNALCCEALCFFTITGWSGVNVVVPGDSITYALGRWFQPHRTSIRRDKQHRPICPGPLNINHALWTYARSARARRALVKPNGSPTQSFVRQAKMFGNTPAEQRTCFLQESNNYLCIIEPHNILGRKNICPEFGVNSNQFDISTWLETVVVI